MEQGTGVEPASSAWEADVLPMYEPCEVSVLYHSDHGNASEKRQNMFLNKKGAA